MKKLTVFVALSLLSVSAFGFIPNHRTTEALVTTNHIYLKDKFNQYWKTSTDCYYDITEDSEVSIKPFNDRFRVNSRVILKVDDQKMVCRITDLQASVNASSVSYNQ